MASTVSEYDWDLLEDGDVTLILFFSFVYFNKTTNFNHKVCSFRCLEQAMCDVRDQMLDGFWKGIQDFALVCFGIKRTMDG